MSVVPRFLQAELTRAPAASRHWLDLAAGALNGPNLDVLRAVNALNLGDHRLAIARFLIAAQSAPNQAIVAQGLARSLEQGQQLEGALAIWLELAAAHAETPASVKRCLNLIDRLGLSYLPSNARLARMRLALLRSPPGTEWRRTVRWLGDHHGVIGAVWIEGHHLHGWAFDLGHPSRQLAVDIFADHRLQTRLTLLGSHPVGRSFSWPLPNSCQEAGCLLDVLADSGERLGGAPLRIGRRPAAWLAQPPGASLTRSRRPPAPSVDLVIPVYDDRISLERCIASLATSRAENRTQFRLILVNDCPHQRGLRSWLSGLARIHDGRYLETPRNLGFIGAVNLAMQMAGNRDLVWLNADTWVSGDWLDRLRAAAQHAPDIATVTPLSNNGQLLSYPRFMAANPMPSAEDTARLHRLAGLANPGPPLELPSGVGFCLYIKQQAWAAAGRLDERAYLLGYSEEVDFCLRLSAAGWRHVCAANVFVAHQGGTSFKADKARLVKENGKVLQARYPAGHQAIKGFQRRDPLYPARARLERLWLAEHPAHWDGLFVLSTTSTTRFFVHDTLLQRRRRGRRDLLLRSHTTQDDSILILEGCMGQPPHNLSFRLPEQSMDLARELLALELRDTPRIYADADLPRSLLDLLAGLERPFEMVALDTPVDHYATRVSSGIAMRWLSRYRRAQAQPCSLQTPGAIEPLDTRADPETSARITTSPGPHWVAILGHSLRVWEQRRLLQLVRLQQDHIRWLVVGPVMDRAVLVSTGRCECLAPPAPERLLEQLAWIGCGAILNVSYNPGPDPSAFLVSRRLNLPYVGWQRAEGVEYGRMPRTRVLPIQASVDALFAAILETLRQTEADPA